jgi:predicted nucleic acid-binding Zn ribbon protein
MWAEDPSPSFEWLEVALNRRNEPAGVGDILRHLAKTTKLGETLEKARLWEHWSDLVGEETARHSRPRTVQKGQLRIEVESAVWMHKLAYRKWEIIKKVNTFAGKELIHDIFLVLIPDDQEVGEE